MNHKVYIEAYIHDRLHLYLEGENKILNDLIKLGFSENEVKIYLNRVEKDIYVNKISKYITKKVKTNKKSSNEFKRKTLNELINKGFNKEDISTILEKVEIIEDKAEIEKIILKLYQKYIKKYDIKTTKLKIKAYLYHKGYTNIEEYLDNVK